MPLNDSEIRALAEAGMIAPYTPTKVRKILMAGPRELPVISYGSSSYGYDLSLSLQDFRIFRHVPGLIVDPKAFDTRCLAPAPLCADETGSYFVLPAHTYALGVVEEYLKLPPDITAFFIGKCVTGDTRVLNAQTGEYASISEFRGGMTASYSASQGVVQSAGTAVIPQGLKEVYTLLTDRSHSIRATASHPFLTPEGWKRLDQLVVGDKVASPRCIPFFGNGDLSIDEAVLMGLMISEGQCQVPNGSPVFTNSDPVLVGLLEGVVATVTGQEVSLKGDMGYALVNKKGRGGIAKKNRGNLWLEQNDMAVKSAYKSVPKKVFEAPRNVVAAFLRALFSGDGSVYKRRAYINGKTYLSIALEYCSTSKRLVEDVRHLLLRFGIITRCYTKHPKNGNTAYVLMVLDAASQIKFFTEIGFWPESANQMRFENGMREIMENVKARQVSDPHIVWEKVKSIEPDGAEEVYDISVPGLENFVANDLIVHNSTYARCGIIVNTTPGEAGWEGYLTLEISNSSGADCKIYAKEGICQALFFCGNPCETPYGDGKYQNQTAGVTVARV